MDDTPAIPDLPDAVAGPGDGCRFNAVLTPHRSLDRTGFVILMTAVAAISFAAGFAFLLVGAWPVFGFFGLDLALIYLAFRINYFSARAAETIALTPNALIVRRYSPRGAVQCFSLQPYWLRVELEDQPSRAGRLLLSSHGRVLSVGAFLTSAERATLAAALKRALDQCRCAPAPAPAPIG